MKGTGETDAVILAAIGSVRNYQVHAVANRDLPSKDLFVRDPLRRRTSSA